MATIPSLKLNDGNEIPLIAYGTGTAWYKSSPSADVDRSMVEAIKTAIRLGYTHLDGAEVYNTERELGAAIRESGVPRESLFVTTKVMGGIADIPAAIEASLKRLQLDHVDLYLVHQPFFAKTDEDLQIAWAAMEGVKRSGKARSIGVSNYLPAHLDATLRKASIPPAINQIEFHPYLQHPELLAHHKRLGIATSAYSPLTSLTRARPGPADDVITRLATAHGVSEAAIALRFCIDQTIAAITTSTKKARLAEYLQATTVRLSEAEVAEIAAAGAKKHFRGYFNARFAADDRS
ncbi:MAG: hypothetical protein M1832_006044 [Thelocarpon impressellum]|nr:MAG: hypothetical protein M1832_006044 [Thelocarpon impressellum]